MLLTFKNVIIFRIKIVEFVCYEFKCVGVSNIK
jgi:hypothetical protein